jgi:simple sugar transport system permease protein
MVPKDLVSLGYDSIAVAVLGNIAPVGTLFASILVTIFQKGSIYMSSNVGVPKDIASVIIGILLMFSASGLYIEEKLQHLGRAVRSKRDSKTDKDKAEEEQL